MHQQQEQQYLVAADSSSLLEGMFSSRLGSSFRRSSWENRVPLFLFVTLVVILVFLFTPEYSRSLMQLSTDCPYKWHGGSPTQSHRGSCWCGLDGYCLCTPSLAIDAIIETTLPGDVPAIVLVSRRDPPVKHAIPGGFVDVGESIEAAAVREVKEETNLDLASLEQFHVYSDPKRDARRHTVSAVFRCVASDLGALKTGDDAKAVKAVPLSEIFSLDLAFDHRQILLDYVKKFHPKHAPSP